MSISIDGASRAYSTEVDSVPDAEWDEIIGGFADAHHEQTACYASRHWKGRDSHLLLRAGGRPVAGARATVFKLPLLGRGLAFVRFGPFWRAAGSEADPRIYRAVVEALVQEYAVTRGHCLTILPRPSPVHQEQEYALLREMGFVRRRGMPDAERYFVDLSLLEEAQMKSFSQNWRYNLRRALGNALEVRLSETPQEAEAFASLYEEMVSRKGFDSATPVHMTRALMEGLPPGLRPRLALAFHEGELLAGATIGLFGDTAYYMFGATSAAALPLNAGYALQWWVIGWLRERGVRWYDLGGAAHEPGLRHFKKGMAGKSGRIVVMDGEYDRWASPIGRLAADAVFAARHARRRMRYGAGYGRLAKA
ncbi:GNAT family N-acetyltransferase [Chelativorans sp. AA-79]|uniref:lipid II:glycine glycyltransferase FemX n=1 Tax=Chelativorans sp. AA-79 TaxID=3028735 RepID=UPI0023F876D5|nr:GNAT family N-acetyltransferase [Chelativorans sp. AA-79]WEX09366.1 GNAT family N-acetyltransferase [Chelativorans sp. AA-79]